MGLTSTATAIRTPNARAREICGDLGVMDGLHGDLDPAQVRMCTEHPFGRNRVLDEGNGASLAPIDDKEPLVAESSSDSSAQLLQERACVTPYTSGCSDGFCWTSCQDFPYERVETGKWCWLAHYYGKGDWATCNTWEDCEKDPTTWCGVGDNCASCGCSC